MFRDSHENFVVTVRSYDWPQSSALALNVLGQVCESLLKKLPFDQQGAILGFAAECKRGAAEILNDHGTDEADNRLLSMCMKLGLVTIGADNIQDEIFNTATTRIADKKYMEHQLHDVKRQYPDTDNKENLGSLANAPQRQEKPGAAKAKAEQWKKTHRAAVNPATVAGTLYIGGSQKEAARPTLKQGPGRVRKTKNWIKEESQLTQPPGRVPVRKMR